MAYFPNEVLEAMAEFDAARVSLAVIVATRSKLRCERKDSETAPCYRIWSAPSTDEMCQPCAERTKTNDQYDAARRWRRNAVATLTRRLNAWNKRRAKLHPNADCRDCGKPYELFPLDLLLPRSQWLDIHPEDGGVLCANCMIERIRDAVKGATAVHAVVEVAPRGR